MVNSQRSTVYSLQSIVVISVLYTLYSVLYCTAKVAFI